MIPLRDTLPVRSTPIVTRGLIVLNVLVFLLELKTPNDALEDGFYLFGIVPARFTHPAWAEHVGFPGHTFWPFLTCMFLHGGWMHLIGNMWTLWIFGDN